MSKTAADVIKTIKDKEVKFLDLRFTDTKGKMQHVTADASCVDEAMFADGYAFAPSTPDDFPMLARWLAQDHVRRWWGDPDEELAEIARIFGDPSMEALIVSHDGRPFAHQQSWDPSLWPDYPLQDQPAGTRGIDQFIGEADMLGQGHGTRFIGAFTRHLLAQGAPRVVIDPDPENLAAIRAYEKAGFTALDVRETGDGPALIMIQEPV